MRLKTTLMMLAATLAPMPLYAQADAVPATVQTQPSAAAMRAAVLAQLALLPADAEAAMYLHLPEDILDELGCDTLAAGAGKGTGDFTRHMGSVFNLFVKEALGRELADVQADDTMTEQVAKAIREVAAAYTPTKEDAARPLQQLHLPPLYLILPATDKTEARLQEALERKKAEAGTDDSVEFVTVGAFQGVKYHCRHTGDKDDTPILEAMDEEIGTRSYYLLGGKMGGCIVYVFCETPEEIHLAASPETSVLGTPAWAAVDDKLGEEICLAMSVSPELGNAVMAGCRDFLTGFAPMADVFNKLAESDSTQADTYRAAAAGVRSLLEQACRHIPDTDKPAFLQAWADKDGTGFHVELTLDACGRSYRPTRHALADKAQDPNTILFVESTPLASAAGIDGDMLATAATAVFNGFLCAQKPEVQKDFHEKLAPATAHMPEIIKTCNALNSIRKGLDGSWAFVLDGNGHSLPSAAILSGVTDRGKLITGWNGLLEVGRDLVIQNTGEAPDLDDLRIQTTTEGGATSFTLDMGDDTLAPDITISDSLVVIGSNAKLDKALFTEASGQTEFAGTRIILRIDPLAKLLEGIDAKDGEDEDSVVEEISGIGEAAERVLDNISGSSTIKDGLHTLRLDVNLK